MKKQNKKFVELVTCCQLILLTLSSSLFSQVTISIPINVNEGLSNGTVQATVVPALTVNSIQNVFDGNPLTEAGVQNSSVLQFTLAFNDSVSFTKSRVYFWHDGIWSMEIADSEYDLNNQTGSYQLLVNQRAFSVFAWDSVDFSQLSAKYFRLSAENLQQNFVYIGEWSIEAELMLTSLYIYPYPPKVIPGRKLQLNVKALDENGVSYPYPLSEPIYWTTANPGIASVDEFGKIMGIALGNTTVTASSSSGSISGTAPVSVLNDFQSTNADVQLVNVSLVLQNPVTNNGLKMHQRFGWLDPMVLVQNIKEDFYSVSEGVIQFQIVEIHDDQILFTKMYGQYLTVDSLTAYYSVPGWTPLVTALQQGQLEFDYHAMIDYYDLCTKRNNGIIDEVWVYAHPYAAMYESRLAGPGAFWYNSPPLDSTSCVKLMSIMGWNYERGLAEALHSLGHRAESSMAQAYGGWHPQASNPTNWDLFSWIDIDHPDSAHVGNVHYPPNGESDYDYSNYRYVECYADNWKRYPYILDEHRQLNCTEWGSSHLGYMRWWYSHLPKYEGVYEGILNNWWHYIVDYEEAVALAESLMTIPVGFQGYNSSSEPQNFLLERNFPNPFNPTTRIRYYLPVASNLSLKVFDVLGREVRTLQKGRFTSGEYEVVFDGKNLASGIYLYRLKTDHFEQSNKMLLLK